MVDETTNTDQSEGGVQWRSEGLVRSLARQSGLCCRTNRYGIGQWHTSLSGIRTVARNNPLCLRVLVLGSSNFIIFPFAPLRLFLTWSGREKKRAGTEQRVEGRLRRWPEVAARCLTDRSWFSATQRPQSELTLQGAAEPRPPKRPKREKDGRSTTQAKQSGPGLGWVADYAISRYAS